jgi:hypothetical protein
MAQKFSFRDPVTNVLKTWGYALTNNPGDISQLELDSFNLSPGAWQWDGSAWVPFTPIPEPDPDEFIADMRGMFTSSATANWSALINAHPAFAFAVINRDYPTIENQLNAARAASQIGNVMWANITTFAANRHLPITLSS